jgi:cytidyltransferase-like protein
MIFHSIKQAASYINALSSLKGKIGVTSGCFDVLHALHVDYLNKCKRAFDPQLLCVLVDSDNNMIKNKNEAPVIYETDRMYMLDNLQAVDIVVLMDKNEDLKTFLTMLDRSAGNDVIMYKNANKIYGADVFKVDKVKLHIIPDVTRFSSATEIRKQIKKERP